jgi:hypothetical protein
MTEDFDSSIKTSLDERLQQLQDDFDSRSLRKGEVVSHYYQEVFSSSSRDPFSFLPFVDLVRRMVTLSMTRYLTLFILA